MYKPLADSTLHRMTKKEIIELLRTAEHNAKVSQEWVAQQAENLKDWKPVVHGRWIEDGSGVIVCQKCNRGYNLVSQFTHYCPNCGAKMDGGDSDEAG